MKRKNGFTLVEIIVSFALTMVVVLFLFQLIITLKQVYTNNFVSSDLILKQSSISNMINKDFNTNYLYDVIGVEQNGDCYLISFSNGQRELCYKHSASKDQNDSIIYNNLEIELVSGSKIGNVNVNLVKGDNCVDINTCNDKFLFIDIPITYPDLDDDYGIKIINSLLFS